MPFLPPNQQCQSIEGIYINKQGVRFIHYAAVDASNVKTTKYNKCRAWLFVKNSPNVAGAWLTN